MIRRSVWPQQNKNKHQSRAPSLGVPRFCLICGQTFVQIELESNGFRQSTQRATEWYKFQWENKRRKPAATWVVLIQVPLDLGNRLARPVELCNYCVLQQLLKLLSLKRLFNSANWKLQLCWFFFEENYNFSFKVNFQFKDHEKCFGRNGHHLMASYMLRLKSFEFQSK